MDILFSVMPFAELDQPSLGVGLLHAAAQQAGFRSSVRYFTFALAERIGAPFYRSCHRCFGSELLAGDWLFAEALFGAEAPPPEGYVQEALALHRRLADPEADPRLFGGKSFTTYLAESILPAMLAARQECTALVERSAAEIVGEAPRVAAFTAGSQQLCAALAVARRVKEAPDPPVVLLGGPSCFGEMGLQLLRSFPWVDYVCTGEGDRVLPEFLERLLRRRGNGPPQGVLGRGAAEALLPPPVHDLDELPLPDFDDFFRAVEDSPLRLAIAERAQLPLETSRGCWWGERSQCTFCGNHPHMQPFRSKSPQHAAAETASLALRYAPRRMALSDDILEPDYFRTLFPLLAARKERVPFFCESKVNLSRLQVKRLREAGCDTVQFGMESLGNRLLALMRKGCTAGHGIRALRWAVELGLEPHWNFLYGFPGETADDYDDMAARLPLLAHLPPPLGCVRIAFKRFSPYHEAPQEYGLTLRPARAYRHIFPLPPEALEGLAYYFETEGGFDLLPPATAVRRLVGRWIADWTLPPPERPRLDMYRAGNAAFLVIDTRSCAVQRVHRLEGAAAEIYLRCDAGATVPELAVQLGIGAKELSETLERLEALRLLWQDEGRYLALALFRNRRDDRKGERW